MFDKPLAHQPCWVVLAPRREEREAMEQSTTEVLDEVLYGLERVATMLKYGRPRTALRLLIPLAVSLRELRYQLWQTEEVAFGFKGDEMQARNQYLQDRVLALRQEVKELRELRAGCSESG